MICIRSGWTSWKRWSFSHWRALTRYVDDGQLEINNSAAERALRAVSIGRKNYLFFGADSGGERAASFYSLIGTAKLNGTDPSFYLRTVLARIAEHPIICFDQLCDLLSLEIITERQRSLRWRLARFEKAGLVTRLQGQTHLRTPVFGITQQGLIFLESRGHSLLSLPSGTEAILHPSQIPHALEMVSIRVAFAKAGVLHSWKSDLEIASRNLVLENERSSKGFRRRCRDRGRRKEAHDRHRIRAEPKSCRQIPCNSGSLRARRDDRRRPISHGKRRHPVSARHGIARNAQADWFRFERCIPSIIARNPNLDELKQVRGGAAPRFPVRQ